MTWPVAQWPQQQPPSPPTPPRRRNVGLWVILAVVLFGTVTAVTVVLTRAKPSAELQVTSCTFGADGSAGARVQVTTRNAGSTAWNVSVVFRGTEGGNDITSGSAQLDLRGIRRGAIDVSARTPMGNPSVSAIECVATATPR